MKIYRDIEQRSKEWFDLRSGKMTASNAQAIISNGAGLKTYVREIVSEMISKGERESYTNMDIDRGVELEPEARREYELYTDTVVDEVTFVEYNDYIGCSPDGLIGEDKGIEIKCPNDKKYLDILLDGRDGVDTKYFYQVQMNLYVTGRKSWDLVFYNPNFDNKLTIITYEPDKETFEKLEKGLESGIKQIEELLIKLNYKPDEKDTTIQSSTR